MSMKIYGNEQPVRLISEMVRKNRKPHSIIISGDKGLGKKTFAKYISAQLMCEEQSGTPCGKCKSCRMLEDDCHPDFKIVEANSNGNYIIDDVIRPIIYDCTIMPNEGDLKVYVIPDLDMSINTSIQAQNILLKLIEEPPKHVVVILTARSKEIFLSTIISRVLSLNMIGVKDAESTYFLKENFPDANMRDITDAVASGRGNIGRCCDYLNKKQFYTCVQIARAIGEAVTKRSEYEVLKALFLSDGKKSILRESCFLFSEVVRDSVVFRNGGRSSDLSVSCDKENAEKIAEILSTNTLGELYDLLCEYILRIDSNCNLTLTANSLAGQIGVLIK